MVHKLTNSIYPVNNPVTMQLVSPNQQVQPAFEWEFIGTIYALAPLIVIIMVFFLLKQLFKPEVLKEVIPIAEKVVVAKAMD